MLVLIEFIIFNTMQKSFQIFYHFNEYRVNYLYYYIFLNLSALHQKILWSGFLNNQRGRIILTKPI